LEAIPYGHSIAFSQTPPLTDDRLPWLRCTDDHLWTYRYFTMSLNSHLGLVFELQAAKIAAGRRASGKRSNTVQPGQLSIWSNLKEE
jgi:hypothetical protein